MSVLTRKGILDVIKDFNDQLSEEKRVGMTAELFCVVEDFLDVIDEIPADQDLSDASLELFNSLVAIEKGGTEVLKEFCVSLEEDKGAKEPEKEELKKEPLVNVIEKEQEEDKEREEKKEVKKDEEKVEKKEKGEKP